MCLEPSGHSGLLETGLNLALCHTPEKVCEDVQQNGHKFLKQSYAEISNFASPLLCMKECYGSTYVCVYVIVVQKWHGSPLPQTAWGHPQAVRLTLALTVCTSQVRLGQVRLGQVRLGQVRHKPIAIKTHNNIKVVTVNWYSAVRGRM